MSEANKESSDLQNILYNQKKLTEEAIYKLKVHNSQEKSIYREQNMQLEAKLTRIEKELADSLRRERDLGSSLKRFEENEKMKKNLREIEKRELDRINRLLILEK